MSLTSRIESLARRIAQEFKSIRGEFAALDSVLRVARRRGDVGSGTTDDWATLQAMADEGGVITLGPGKHLISKPLVLKSGAVLRGTFSPTYMPQADPAVIGSRIAPTANFQGTSLVQIPGTARGVRVEGVALVGLGQGTAIDGMRFADTTTQGEMALTLRDVGIYGMSGSGMSGSLTVGTFENVHIAMCGKHGIEIASGSKWVDCKISKVFAYFNRRSGFMMDGANTAAVQIHQSRFERSGQTYGDSTNAQGGFNPDEAGIRIKRGRFITLTDCTTDANTGPGLDITPYANGSSEVNNIVVNGGWWARDAGGNQATSTQGAAIRIKGVSNAPADTPNKITLNNPQISPGKSSDTGSGTLISPYFGVQIENGWQVAFNGRKPDTTVPFSLVGGQWGNEFEWVDLAGQKWMHAPEGGVTTPTQVDPTKLPAHKHPTGDLTATGTPSATTYLCGDGSWATPARLRAMWSTTATVEVAASVSGTATVTFPAGMFSTAPVVTATAIGQLYQASTGTPSASSVPITVRHVSATSGTASVKVNLIAVETI